MNFPTRPTLMGYGGAVSAGHYLATQVGAQQLADGGNAADAACAMGFALQVLEPTQNGPAGEVPILVYQGSEDRNFAISGQGTAPAAANIPALRECGVELIPDDGFLAATVPAAIDAWCRLLERFGTRRLADVMAPAQVLAVRGFPMHPFLHANLHESAARFRDEWPTSAAIYLPVRAIGERQCNPALGEFYGELIRAERNAGTGRETAIRAARDCFYTGRHAEQIERFLSKPVRDATGLAHAGLLTADDLANYAGRVEQPLSTSYRGARVWKCPSWTQGPVFLQQLRLLEGFDLAAMGAGSADALHHWIECAKLAFADREACYGDPDFTTVPMDELLSDSYSQLRRSLVDPASASHELRPGMGKLPAGWPLHHTQTQGEGTHSPASVVGRSDTTQLVSADRWGNLVSATPSGGWIGSSPVIPELGFPIGTRGQMFSMDPDHPNSIQPGKRPRTTLTPSLALLPDGRRLAFGTPGGDRQDQWTVQFLLQLVDFKVQDLQTAIEKPTVESLHMPSSFYPRQANLGVIAVEDRVAPAVLTELEARGHRLNLRGPWEHGRVLAASVDSDSGRTEAAASPRHQIAYAAALPS